MTKKILFSLLGIALWTISYWFIFQPEKTIGTLERIRNFLGYKKMLNLSDIDPGIYSKASSVFIGIVAFLMGLLVIVGALIGKVEP